MHELGGREMSTARPPIGDVVRRLDQRDQLPQSGRDLSQTAIWAGIVAASETIPAQIDQ
jgi:hypothetical protein